MKDFIKSFKMLWWDINRKATRFEWIRETTGFLPGEFGFHVRRWLWSPYFKSAGKDIAIHKHAAILNPQNLVLKDFARIGPYNYLQAGGGIELGEKVMMGPYVKIWSANHRFDDPSEWIQLQGYENKPVKIGNHVWIGAGAIILPGAQIGDRCIVAAGSVVNAKNYPPNLILSGNPARKVGERPTEEPSSEQNAEAPTDEPK